MSSEEVFLHRLDLAEQRAMAKRDYHFRQARKMHEALTKLRAVAA